ncbi:MAG: hypothetical protein JKY56_21380 [Kofleriaceae bacterium]|nr:hypothetical protein [Kofleriaceae bacterium]
MTLPKGSNISSKARERATKERLAQFVSCLAPFRRDHLQAFLDGHQLSRSGSKAQLLERIRDALLSENITEEDIFVFLGKVEPLDKQHVFLLAGPEGKLKSWTERSAFRKKLKSYPCAALLDAPLSLLLPSEMTLASIQHQDSSLEISAFCRRDTIDRRPDNDKVAIENDETILYQAYHRTSSRGLIRFHWNFTSNTAILQVGQLPSRGNYEREMHTFAELVAPWLDLNLFSAIDLSRAISTFHALENTEEAETRSQEIDYSVEGRRVSGKAATASDPLLGVAIVDHALSSFRQKGIGYAGNFYFQPTTSPTNPISEGQEVHVQILAEKDRVRFFTANTEEVFSYVLQRIRAASQRQPR